MKLHNGITVDDTVKTYLGLRLLSSDNPEFHQDAQAMEQLLKLDKYREEFFAADRGRKLVPIEHHLGKVPWDGDDCGYLTTICAAPLLKFRFFQTPLDLDDNGQILEAPESELVEENLVGSY